MGYYKGSLRDLGWTELELVRRANDMARYAFLYQGYQSTPGQPTADWVPPPIFAKTIGMMGLRDVRQHGVFNVVAPELNQGRGGGGGGGRGRGAGASAGGGGGPARGRGGARNQGQVQGPGHTGTEAHEPAGGAQSRSAEGRPSRSSWRRDGRGRGIGPS